MEMGEVRRHRVGLAVCLALGLILLQVQAAGAAVTIGSASLDSPDGDVSCGTPCAIFNAQLPAGGLTTSPVNGTITSWGMNATTGGTSVRLRVLQPLGGDQYRFVRSGPLATGLSAGPHQIPVTLPVSLGERIALEHNSVGAIGLRGSVTPIPGARWQWIQPATADGTEGAVTINAPTQEVLLNATIEPSNDATLTSLTKNKKKGTAAATISLPNAGTLSVQSNFITAQTMTATSPGPVTLTLRPVKKTRKALGRKGKSRGSVSFTFTPSFGSPSTDTTQVGLKKKRKRR